MKPIEWHEYAKMVSGATSPLYKYRIAKNLIVLAQLHSKPPPPFDKLWSEYNKDEIMGSQQMFALQSIATTFELTENFAAMCFAYAEAIKYGKKFYPLLLRDFGFMSELKNYRQLEIDVDLGSANALFQEIKDNHDAARKYLGLLTVPRKEVEKQQKIISILAAFRDKYDRWYQKFKHTNSVVNISLVFDVPGEYSVVHTIPQYLKFTNNEVKLKDRLTLKAIDRSGKFHKLHSDSYLTPYQFQDEIMKTLDLIIEIWILVRHTQHRALFQEEIPKR